MGYLALMRVATVFCFAFHFTRWKCVWLQNASVLSLHVSQNRSKKSSKSCVIETQDVPDHSPFIPDLGWKLVTSVMVSAANYLNF